MSYKLVIAEKPSVAQSIAKVIGADKRAIPCCKKPKSEKRRLSISSPWEHLLYQNAPR